MNICLVNPSVPAANLYGKWDLSAVDNVSPPLGLLFLAAVIRQAGYGISLVDAYAMGLSPEDSSQHILSQNPDIVGITATTFSIHGAAVVARLLKNHNSKLKIIIGGPHITAAPLETFKLFPQFDIGVIGEGEDTIVELLNYLSHKEKSLTSIKSIIFRNNGDILKTDDRTTLVDMNRLPLPAWDLLHSFPSAYRMSIVGTTSNKSTSIITSRGCPGKCTFCAKSVFGSKFRAHNANYVISMIEYLINNYGIKDFIICDENFTVDHKRLKQIYQTLIENKYNITWSCAGRVDMVNPEILKLMKKAGCWQIAYGIESGSPEILKIMKKGTNNEQVRQTLKWTKEAGIMNRGNFIFGYLGETKETLRETLKFILDIDLDYFQQMFLTPYPGTPIYQTARQYGKTNQDWTRMSNIEINFIPDGLTEEDLIKFSKEAFRKFYLRPKIIWTHLQRLRSLEDIKRNLTALITLIKTIFR